jgi:hypothetical protein
MKKFIPFIPFVLALASCTPQFEETAFRQGQEVTLNASVSTAKGELPNKQRITGLDTNPSSATDGVIDLRWSAGDQILVRVGDTSAAFQLISGANTDQATFRGTMPADGLDYHVTYPINYHDSLLSHQNYVRNGFANGLMKMSTKAPGTLDDGFTLSADNALLGLQLTGNHILGKIIVTNLYNDSTYTLHCDGVILQSDQPTLFYIVVPASDWTQGMRVEAFDQTNKRILYKEKTDGLSFLSTQATIMPALQAREPGKRIGVFSVSPQKKVSFAQGNLQYIQSTKTWQFAENQYTYLGAANLVNKQLADHIDLFGWSGQGTKIPFGVGVSTTQNDYKGNFVDWGKNRIQGDEPNTWRTLTIEEWEYIYHGRENADQLLALATVGGVPGLIFLPDNWQQPAHIPFYPSVNMGLMWDASRHSGSYIDTSDKDHTQDNVYTQTQWQTLEALGAVFLPCAGWRPGNVWNQAGIVEVSTKYLGSYWSSSIPQTSSKNYYFFRFTQQEIRKFPFTLSNNLLFRGRSVRLVHDTLPPIE